MLELLPLKGDERVLDIGCGDGRVTEKIALRVPDGQVWGIDASISMIASAKTRESSNLHFRVMSARELSYDEEFDVVFSHAALHWVSNHENLLKRIYDALRTGGYARLNFAAEGASPAMIQVIRETMSHPAYSRYFPEFVWPWYMPTLTAYREMLARSPFEDVEVSIEHKERLFPSTDSIIKWIDQPCLVPFLAVVGEDDKQEFRAAVIKEVLDRTRQESGGFLEQFYRLDIRARKTG